MRLLEVKGNDGSGRTLSRGVVAWANVSKSWYGTEDALKGTRARSTWVMSNPIRRWMQNSVGLVSGVSR